MGAKSEARRLGSSMVRGGGSRSHGSSSSHSRSYGGGSRSYISSYNGRSNYASYGGSSRNSLGEGCDCDDCGSCCGDCNFCKDFGPMAVSSVFLLVLFLFPLIGSLITVTLEMDPGETRILNYGGSTFVNTVSFLSPADSDVNVYFLPKPMLGPAPDTASYRNKEDLVLGAEEYLNFEHWLNKGSTIDLTYSAEYGAVHMYILKSEATWSKWKETFEDGSHYSTYWSSVDMYRYSSNRATQHVTYKVKEDDLYVLVFVNENWSREAEVRLDYSLRKTDYQVSEAVKPVCGPDRDQDKLSFAKNPDSHTRTWEYEDHDGWCHVPLHFHEWNVILLTTPSLAPHKDNAVIGVNVTLGTMSSSTDDGPVLDQVYSLSYNCAYRTGYMLILLSLCFCCCCGYCVSNSRSRNGDIFLIDRCGLGSLTAPWGRTRGYQSVDVELSQSRVGYNITEASSTAVTDQPMAVATVVGAEGPGLPSVELKTATAPSLA